jgi:hypothetical protein
MENQDQKQVHFPFLPKRDRIASNCVCCGSDKIQRSPAILMPFVAHRAFGWEPVEIDESWGLLTIKKGNAYSVCNSLLCEACDFLFLDIRFSDGEMFNLYDDYRGEAYTKLRDFYEPGYSMRNDQLKIGVDYIGHVEKFLEHHLKLPVSILDWGGDTGKNSPFKSRNTRLDIYDISNIPTISGAQRVTKEEALSKKYDLIVCSNVLEHVSYPSDLLADIKMSMDEKSLLYIEVPFEDIMVNAGNNVQKEKKHWHEHINFFSEKSLQYLVENFGLKIIDVNKIHITAGGKTSLCFQIACKLSKT